MPGSERSRSSGATWPEPAPASLRRRDLLRGALALGAFALLPRVSAGDSHTAAYRLPEATRRELGASALVYVSPLHSDGRESRCHGEVWFSFDDGAVLIATAHDGWKARAVATGRDTARVWVGDLGRGSSAQSKLADAPTFRARAHIDTDPAAFERLLRDFGRKYPDEWDKWEPRFRKGYEERTRIAIRYEPIGA